MKIAWHLHLHQPPTQFPFVVTQVSTNCYRLLFALLNDNSGLRLNLSVSAALIEWWERLGFSDLLEALRYLVVRGQVELTGTGAYHPILTLLPESEIIRQIKLEEERLCHVKSWRQGRNPASQETSHCKTLDLGEPGSPAPRFLRGFFSPEMAIDQHLVSVLSQLGYSWVLADEVAALDQPHFLQVADLVTKVVLRDRGASLAVAFGYAQTLPSFKNMVEQYGRFQNHLVLVLDGETFGHHWPGALEFLKEVAAEKSFKFATISELLIGQNLAKIAQVAESTWGTSNADLARGDVYPKWKMLGNELHGLQWELTDLAIKTVNQLTNKPINQSINQLTDSLVNCFTGSPNANKDPVVRGSIEVARSLLDRALHSDQYWWASHNPYWNLEMVARGARMLADVAKTSEAEALYNKIITRGKELYGEEVITG